MTRALNLATNWRPYAYLAFAILLLLVDPVARGVMACASDKAPGGCPVIGGQVPASNSTQTEIGQ